jgi:hypothetical protein
MRYTTIAAVVLLIVAAVALWSVTVMGAKTSPNKAAAASAPAVGVMQMMERARGLPAQQFDAF